MDEPTIDAVPTTVQAGDEFDIKLSGYPPNTTVVVKILRSDEEAPSTEIKIEIDASGVGHCLHTAPTGPTSLTLTNPSAVSETVLIT